MVPTNPKSMNFEVPELYSTTHNGDQFLIYDSAHKKIGGRLMIFSTEVLIKTLCSCEVILVDGTFETRPMMFSQVYVIMGMHLADGQYLFLSNHIQLYKNKSFFYLAIPLV